MDFSVLMLITVAVALIAMTFRAQQIGLARRDVTVLGALSGLSGLGSVAISLT